VAVFGRAFLATVEWEGGYVNDPDDAGGETRYGISKRQYPDEDIQGLTLERARELYKRDYWDALGLDKLNSQPCAEKVFDMAVNMGMGVATRCLQRACNYLISRSKEVKVDGKLGKRTRSAANWITRNSTGGRRLLLALRGYHFGHYGWLVEGPDTRYEKFAAGWLERALG